MLAYDALQAVVLNFCDCPETFYQTLPLQFCSVRVAKAGPISDFRARKKVSIGGMFIKTGLAGPESWPNPHFVRKLFF